MTLPPRRRARYLASALCLLLFTAPMSGAVPAAPVQTGGAPGTVTSSHSVPHPLNAVAPALRAVGATPGPVLSRGEAHRIGYVTTDPAGAHVPATALVIEPLHADAPTLVMAPGTRGTSDFCAPSASWLQVASADGAGHVNLNYELPVMYRALSRGMRVVLVDYAGLGTPGPHLYGNREAAGHSVLDAARAATGPGEPVLLYGFSQGGGATGAAVEMAPRYAPGLNIKAAYVGAAPADLGAIARSLDGSILVGALGWALNAASEEPDVAAAIQRNLNERGRRLLRDAEASCTLDTIARWGFHSTREYTVDGASIAEVAQREPALSAYFERQALGRQRPQAPVLIAGSEHDRIVPWAQLRQLAEDWRALGASVTLRRQPGDLGLATHAGNVFLGADPAFDWLMARAGDGPGE